MKTMHPQTTATHRPKFQTRKSTTGVSIRIDLPGVKREHVTISSEKNRLRIEASRSDAIPEDWALLNDSTRPSDYLLELNTHSDLDLLSTIANLRNGVLTLEISRREESLPRQIPLSDS